MTASPSGDCLDVGEPLPQFADEVDDLPAGLVADASHQVDVADREAPAGRGR